MLSSRWFRYVSKWQDSHASHIRSWKILAVKKEFDRRSRRTWHDNSTYSANGAINFQGARATDFRELPRSTGTLCRDKGRGSLQRWRRRMMWSCLSICINDTQGGDLAFLLVVPNFCISFQRYSFVKSGIITNGRILQCWACITNKKMVEDNLEGAFRSNTQHWYRARQQRTLHIIASLSATPRDCHGRTDIRWSLPVPLKFGGFLSISSRLAFKLLCMDILLSPYAYRAGLTTCTN